MSEFRKTKRQVDSETIECEVCDSSEHVFRRTSVRNISELLISRMLRLSEDTKVVSLSASENHTYGGPVRLVFDRADLSELEQMCYVEADSRSPHYRTYIKKRDRLSQEVGSLNRADAILGVILDLYKDECEAISRKPIPLDKVKRVEYWLAPKPLEFQVSCHNRLPHHIDGSGWSWKSILEDMEKTKQFARDLDVPFSVKSCFDKVKFGWGGHIPLDDSNLERLSQGQSPEIVAGEGPEGKCRC